MDESVRYRCSECHRSVLLRRANLNRGREVETLCPHCGAFNKVRRENGTIKTIPPRHLRKEHDHERAIQA